MNKKLTSAIIASALLIPNISTAKPKIGNIDVVHIKADKVIYQKDSKSYYADGHCIVSSQQYSLRGDKAYFSKDTSIVELHGNILFENKKGDWIRGTKAIFNTSTYKGFVDNAVMYIKSEHLYIKAKKIIIDSKDRYYIKNAMATGCKCDKYLLGSKKYHPKWSIKTKHIYIVKDKYLLAYPATFKIRQIPVFFTPVIYKGLSKKRKSGLLFPSVGVSTKDGFKYKQPIFWAIDKSKDITFSPFIYDKAGYGFSINARFYLTKNSKGKWYIIFFKEKTPYGSSKEKKDRITLEARQFFETKKYGTLKYDLDIVSDKNNFRVINKDNMDLTSKKYTKSTVSYFLEKNEYSLGVNGYFYQDLFNSNNRKTIQKLPEINLNITNKKLWNNLTLDFENTATNNYAQEGIKGYSDYVYASLSYPIKLDYISIIPKVGIYNAHLWWKNTYEAKKYSKNILTPIYSLKASTMLNGYFFKNNSNLLGIKHSITPSLEYRYVAKRNWSKFPDFISKYDKSNSIMATLENRVVIKYTKNNIVKYRELLYNKLMQQYDFNKNEEENTHFPALYSETRISPFEFLKFSSKSHFSVKKLEFKDMDNSIEFDIKPINITLSHLLQKDGSYKKTDENIKLTINAYPTKKLYLYAYIEKNMHNHYFPQKKAGFMYKEDCWGIGIDLYENQTPKETNSGVYERKKDSGFWITLTFKGLGKIRTQNKQWMSQ